MEQDRYQQNSLVFIIGMVSLLLSLCLLAFSFYILPYLLFSWVYSVPELVLFMREWFRDLFNFTENGASWLVFLSFFLPALIFGYISQLSSNFIDDRIYHIKEDTPQHTEEIRKDVQETVSFGLKLFLLIVLVFVIVLSIHWLIAKPPPI